MPIILSLMICEFIFIQTFIKRLENFINPILPNFSIKPAKIIEHTPEALTWAFVSQKCKKKIGSFLAKIKVIKKKYKILDDENKLSKEFNSEFL